MKPSFALNFTDDSVALLHRTKRGWLEVGRSAYDTPDLAEAMAYMRATALGLSPQGVTTKLVIPASQIRYFRIDAPGPADSDRRAQIAAALEGRTAYAVEELAFDWSGSGPAVNVAVVARETLAEAEAFATTHRFGPLSFVAIPEDGAFDGEPWFGPTGQAAGTSVDRDPAAITILSRALPRDSAPAEVAPQVPDQPEPPQEPAPTVETEGPTPPGSATEAAAENPAEPAPELPVNDPPAPTPDEPPAEPEPEPVTEPEDVPDPVTDPEPAPEPDPVPEPVPATVPEPAPERPDPEPLQIPQPDVTPEPAGMPDFDPIGEPVTMQMQAAETDEAPIALDVEDDDLAPLKRRNANVTDTSLTELDDKPATAAFTSRRVPALAGATAAAAQSMARRLGAASRSAAAAVPSAPRPAKFGFPDPVDPQSRPVTPVAKPSAAKVTPPRPVPPVGKTPSDTAAPPTQRPTVARPAKAARPGPRSLTAPARGKPRYLGLMLTGLLLVALALAAAFSSYIAASNDSATPDRTELASNAAADAPVPADPAAPSIDDEMLADGQDPEAAADPAGADLTTADLGVTAQAPAGVPAEAPAQAPDPAAEAVAPAAAPVTDLAEGPGIPASKSGNDEIFLSASDIAPSAVDAAALPLPAARADPAPTAPLPPPAFGTVYQFDANGLIVPTAEGITTPEGVFLVAGKPPLVPPPRPAALTPPPADAAASPAAASGDQPQTSPADPALLGKRPAPRPADLVTAPEPAADPNATLVETANAGPSLAPAAGSRIAALRPLPRPGTIAPAASASLALVTPESTVSPLGGLALSPRPVARPSAIASAVEAAVAAAAMEPAPEPEPAPAIVDTGNVTPETEQEPELASAAPSIPTKANVAKEATDKNVINLGKINLIGVYGTQSNRYALVRQPNGRIVKVSVGDRIDGGRVAAVTATEVRYEKRGQMLVLAMPRG